MMARFVFSVFLSAFLLFQVQPMIARYILPWFGGSAAVWTVCLLFFQVTLLAGYAYAHLLSKIARPRTQAVVHLGLLALSLLALPITPAGAWRPDGGGDPTAEILLLLLTTVGFPYLVVSTSGPILQHWFSRKHPGKSPYRLYAVSNAGSLLGLVTYPFLVEPALALTAQMWMWTASYAIYVVFCGWIAVGMFSEKSPAGMSAGNSRVRSENPPFGDKVLWVVLAACGSMLLLSTTNQMCQNVAVVPFLWVLPLALYLGSFILCFEHDRWARRRVVVPAAIGGVAAFVFLLYEGEKELEMLILYQVPLYSLALFACCMFCHGELARLRPAPDQLTSFYLAIALGGAAGGFFVGVVSPKLFSGYWEFHVALLLTAFLIGLCPFRGRFAAFRELADDRRFAAWLFGLTALSALLWNVIAGQRKSSLVATRNFYGVLNVYEYDAGRKTHDLSLRHGRITHGVQYTADAYRGLGTAYYSQDSGVGLAFRFHPKRRARESAGAGSALRIGAIGLGAGTIAVYCEPGDVLRFYEINPAVGTIARERFSYLRDAQGDVDVVIGDGRILLEKEFKEEGSREYDILVVDAFSGDSVPVHLLTKEAFELYWKHLRPDGILAVNVTNKHLDLDGVVAAIGRHLRKESILVNHVGKEFYEYSSDWVLMTENREFIERAGIAPNGAESEGDARVANVWTDDYSNLVSVLRLKGAP